MTFDEYFDDPVFMTSADEDLGYLTISALKYSKDQALGKFKFEYPNRKMSSVDKSYALHCYGPHGLGWNFDDCFERNKNSKPVWWIELLY